MSSKFLNDTLPPQKMDLELEFGNIFGCWHSPGLNFAHCGNRKPLTTSPFLHGLTY